MTWFQALNPLFVFALTPLLLAWWRRRAEKATSQSPAIGRMALGAALVGASYVMLAVLTQTSQGQPRSEEHTSELQSLMRISYAVFCLKKKNNRNKRSKLRNDH